MNTPITYYGGKMNLTRELLKLIPEHYQYCEAFVGGGALLFEKPKSRHEAINDIDNRLINFWEVLKQDFNELKKLIISKRLHSEKYFKDAWFILKNQSLFDKISIAWAFWYVSQLSFGHSLNSFAFSNSERSSRLTANKVDQFDKKFEERIKKVEIFNRDAIDFIRLKDNGMTFFYFDPPYIESDCGHYENKKEIYYRLVDELPKLKAKWLFSSFENDLTENLRKQYNSKIIIQPLRVNGKRKETKYKTELLIWNYQVNRGLFDS